MRYCVTYPWAGNRQPVRGRVGKYADRVQLRCVRRTVRTPGLLEVMCRTTRFCVTGEVDMRAIRGVQNLRSPSDAGHTAFLTVLPGNERVECLRTAHETLPSYRIGIANPFGIGVCQPRVITVVTHAQSDVTDARHQHLI